MKKHLIPIFLTVLCFCLVFSASKKGLRASDEKYPSRSIDCFCAYPAGGYADLINRFFVKALEKQFRVTVVPGNKPGGGEIIAAVPLANSPADGYTMAFLADGPLVHSVLLGMASDYKDKISVVSQMICTTQVVAVSADSPWKTFGEFVDYAHKNPGLTYAHGGVGTATHLRMEYINHVGNLKMRGVPFKGDPEVLTAVLGKHVAAGNFSYQAAKTQVDTGKMRILFSFTPPGAGPDPSLPTIPSFFGKDVPDIPPPSIYLAVPRKVPHDIFKTIEGAAERIGRDPEFLANTASLYAQVCYQDSESARKILDRKMVQLKPLLQRAGLIK